MTVSEWPPRFTITPEGVAGLFLRKNFADASGKHQQELADLFRAYILQERQTYQIAAWLDCWGDPYKTKEEAMYSDESIPEPLYRRLT